MARHRVAGRRPAAHGNVQNALATGLIADLRLGWVTVVDLARQGVTAAGIVALALAGACAAAVLRGRRVAAGARRSVLDRAARARRAAARVRPRVVAALPARRAAVRAGRGGRRRLLPARDPARRASSPSAEQTGYFGASFRVVEVLVDRAAARDRRGVPDLRPRGLGRTATGCATRSSARSTPSLLIGALVAVGLGVGAPFVIEVVAGPDFGPAADVLRLHARRLPRLVRRLRSSATRCCSLRRHRAGAGHERRARSSWRWRSARRSSRRSAREGAALAPRRSRRPCWRSSAPSRWRAPAQVERGARRGRCPRLRGRGRARRRRCSSRSGCRRCRRRSSRWCSAPALGAACWGGPGRAPRSRRAAVVRRGLHERQADRRERREVRLDREVRVGLAGRRRDAAVRVDGVHVRARDRRLLEPSGCISSSPARRDDARAQLDRREALRDRPRAQSVAPWQRRPRVSARTAASAGARSSGWCSTKTSVTMKACPPGRRTRPISRAERAMSSDRRSARSTRSSRPRRSSRPSNPSARASMSRTSSRSSG